VFAMTMEIVKKIVEEMMVKGVHHAFPSREMIGKMKNHDIKEIIIDEEGNVFILPVVGEEVMLPQFMEVVGY
jgi:hypothetical protein